MQFQNKVALVTGGAQGIGRACAEMFTAEGADVAILDVDLSTARATAADLSRDDSRCIAIECDVANSSAVAAAINQANGEFGRLDFLVNNAGTGAVDRTEDLSEEAWDRVLDITLKGTFLCSQHAGRVMLAQGSGAIVNIASMVGTTAFPNRAAYASAKAGVVALTRVTSNEWAPLGIRVNAVSPGYVRTPITELAIAAGVHEPERIEARTPLARMGRPDEVAAAVCYLASDAAAFVTGEVLVIDGGYSSYAAWWPPSERRA